MPPRETQRAIGHRIAAANGEIDAVEILSDPHGHTFLISCDDIPWLADSDFRHQAVELKPGERLAVYERCRDRTLAGSGGEDDFNIPVVPVGGPRLGGGEFDGTDSQPGIGLYLRTVLIPMGRESHCHPLFGCFQHSRIAPQRPGKPVRYNIGPPVVGRYRAGTPGCIRLIGVYLAREHHRGVESRMLVGLPLIRGRVRGIRTAAGSDRLLRGRRQRSKQGKRGIKKVFLLLLSDKTF